MRPIKRVKNQIRIIGWDDGPFSKGSGEDVPVIGVVFRGGEFLDGVLRVDVKNDGMDATEKIAEAINRSRHKDQLRVIMLDGISYAGFNMVDIKLLSRETGLPVIPVTRKKVDFEKFRNALKKLPGFQKRWEAVENAGPLYHTSVQGKDIYFQTAGIERRTAERIIHISATRSSLPEPIRVAHLIASAVVRGESIGGA
ncbi:MAG: hypothetical protein DRP11_05315 [Candidatus Aenigmatarchaeota archaeon]|nr:MAG: hypothetical protein DRP11_05315 [Candidatus Aenigmarchaeota archaeon]